MLHEVSRPGENGVELTEKRCSISSVITITEIGRMIQIPFVRRYRSVQDRSVRISGFAVALCACLVMIAGCRRESLSLIVDDDQGTVLLKIADIDIGAHGTPWPAESCTWTEQVAGERCIGYRASGQGRSVYALAGLATNQKQVRVRLRSDVRARLVYRRLEGDTVQCERVQWLSPGEATIYMDR